jgi:hypothetical protein
VLVMTGANSAVGLRSMPVRYLFLDEVDGYPLDVEGEGDAISLAEARTRTFARRKIFIVSTPTISGRERHRARVRGQRPAPLLRAVPALLAPAVAALRATALGQGATGNRRLHLRVLRHRDCRASQDVDAGARRVARDGGGQDGGLPPVVAVQPGGLAQWRDIAAAWEAAVNKESGSAAAIKTFKNTELGETWVEEGEAPDWQRLVERREDYRIGSVPLGGLLLVGGPTCRRIASRPRSGPSGAARSPGWSSTAC